MTGLNGTERVRSLAKSFRFAARGVRYCVRNERNMRIHLTAATYVLVFSAFYSLSATQYAVLLLVIALVLFAETVNTAVEAVVNLQTQCYDNIARIAKDVAAGAVMITAFFAVIVGLLFFLKPPTLAAIVLFLLAHPLWGICFLFSLPCACLFIFCYPAAPLHRR